MHDFLNVLKDVGEQLLHMAWGFAPVCFLWLCLRRPHWTALAAAGGATASLAFALPRELVDQWPIDRWWDTVLDLTFFALGGSLGGILGWRAK